METTQKNVLNATKWDSHIVNGGKKDLNVKDMKQKKEKKSSKNSGKLWNGYIIPEEGIDRVDG